MINTLADITRTHRIDRPGEIALRVPDQRDWTIEQLETAACTCANALRDAGIGEGGRIAFLAKNAPEFFLCLLYTSPSPRDATQSRMTSSA